MKTNTCPLCNIIYNKDDIANTILFENENYFVVPTIGPICNGHAMIVSKTHYESLAKMPQSDIISILEIFDLAISIYKDSNILFTEHGSFDTLNGGNCIVHTHIHILPDMAKHISILDDVLPISTVSNIKDLHEVNAPYILMHSNFQTKLYLAYNAHSQMVRKALSSTDNSVSSDWRKNRFDEKILTTISLWEK